MTADLDVLGMVSDRLDQPDTDPRSWWFSTARAEQRLPPLKDDWRILYFQGGRGSGKTMAGAAGLAEIILGDTDSGGQYGIVAPTYRDAWTVCVEGESGILRALGTSAGEVKNHTSKTVEYAYRSYGEIGLRTGHVIYVDSADDGALRVQGKNLRAVWGDELGLWTRWQTAWDESIRYAVRKGASKIIVTGTPKVSRPARALIRRLIRGGEPGVIVRRLRTIDNIKNLSEAFYTSVIGMARGTRLERQELEGELLDDIEGALWSRDLVDAAQCPWIGEEGGPPFLTRTYIGVDPSDGLEDSDEQAYTVVSRGQVDDPHIYVTESWGGQASPVKFAKMVIRRAVELHATLVIEKNHGGEWLRATFTEVMRDLREHGEIPPGMTPPVELVSASKAKRTRAEPVAALYDRGIVRHCQRNVKYQIIDQATGEQTWHADTERFTELEDQMCSYTGAVRERSPDRLDSLVWACHFFLNLEHGKVTKPGKRDYALRADLDAEYGDIEAEPRDGRELRRRLASAHGGAYDRAEGDWTEDGFAPHDDETPAQGKARANVHNWRL